MTRAAGATSHGAAVLPSPASISTPSVLFMTVCTLVLLMSSRCGEKLMTMSRGAAAFTRGGVLGSPAVTLSPLRNAWIQPSAAAWKRGSPSSAPENLGCHVVPCHTPQPRPLFSSA